MGDILAGIGLGSAEALRRQLAGWRQLLAKYAPDLVITDYAPGAVLAARGRVRCLAVGSGFVVPPATLGSFPPLHDLSPVMHDESAIVTTVNTVLSDIGGCTIEALPQALSGDAQCVRTLSLLDPYSRARDKPVLGPLLGASIIRRAPDADQVFCYLHKAPEDDRSHELVDCLKHLPAPVVAYLPDLDAARRDDLRRHGVSVSDGAVSLPAQLARSRLVVHLGGLGVASAALLAGVPQVIMDSDVEKSLTAAALCDRGVAKRFDYRTAEPEVVRAGIWESLVNRVQEWAAFEAAQENARYRTRDVLSEIAAACESLAPRPNGRKARSDGQAARAAAVTHVEDSRMSSTDPAGTTEAAPKLDCYALHRDSPRIVPARVHRDWMDEFPDRHIYRCLPLAIANTFGWDMLCPAPLEIEWNGGQAIADVTVRALKPLPGGRPVAHFCKSHFSQGTVTFHPDYVFRTDPGWALMATGPFNTVKDGALPMTGIIETDWLPYTFTMNWKLTRPGRILFEEDEPFCSILPVRMQPIVECQPQVRRLSDNPELSRQHEEFRCAREEFNARRAAGDDAARDEVWQRHYFVGRFPDGSKPEEHLNKLRLKEPIDLRPEEPWPKTDAATRSVPWAAESPLNEIEPGQSADNDAGRRRLTVNGELADWSQTYLVRSAADAAGCDFLIVDDLLSVEQCAAISQAFHDLEDRLFRSDTIDPYWNNRFLWYSDIARERPAAAATMREAQQRAVGLLQEFYGLNAPVYSDILQIVRWKQGMFMPPHADNANPDGSPHGMPYRDFAGIVYINDDYEGGELYFTALDIAVKPRPGMFVAMTGGFHHEHAVLRVRSGTRLTMPSFMTFDRAKANPELV